MQLYAVYYIHVRALGIHVQALTMNSYRIFGNTMY